MSKSYLLLIGALILVILAVGGFAFYRSMKSPVTNSPSMYPSSSNSNPSSPTPSGNPTVPSNPAPTTAPVAPTPGYQSQNQITLTVTSPQNGQTVSAAALTVSGKTVPNADVAVNDQDIKANAAGNFSTSLTLDEGDNDISIVASDDSGNSSEWDGTVTYNPSQ